MICVYLEVQCCGSGSGRIRSFLWPGPGPDPDPNRRIRIRVRIRLGELIGSATLGPGTPSRPGLLTTKLFLIRV